jgi:cell division protein FtsZ
MFELVEKMAPNAVIKVIGVGGGGGNAVAHMVNSNVEGVEFICANTDAQAIKGVRRESDLQLGGNVTKGLGAGANPEVGRQAALEDRERIVEALEGADMVFITAGMGGGTGTGAAPVVAQLAKEMGILTVAVVTKPFPFEGRRRMQVALKGIEELSHHCDSLITIPNEKLITVLGREATMIQAFRAANDVLLGAVQGIADLIVRPGLINVDFADVRTVMSEMGMAMMGSGVARGDERAMAAAEAAISNPLLDDVNLSGANGILVNITAGPDFTMREFDEVGRTSKNSLRKTRPSSSAPCSTTTCRTRCGSRWWPLASTAMRRASRCGSQSAKWRSGRSSWCATPLPAWPTMGQCRTLRPRWPAARHEPRPKPGWAGTRWTTSTFLPSCAARPTDRPATLGRADSTRRARDLSKPCLSSRCCLDCQARGTPAQLNSVQRECCKNATTRRFCVVFGFPPQKSRDILRRLWLCSCSET